MGPAEIVRQHKQVVITVTLVTNLMKIDPSECHSSEGFKVRRLQTLQSKRYHPSRHEHLTDVEGLASVFLFEADSDCFRRGSGRRS